MQQALNPPKDQLAFSVFAVVITKHSDTLLAISDLVSTGSTERLLLLQGETATRTTAVGDLLLLINPVADRGRLTVNATRNFIAIGNIPDVVSCTSGSCRKPVVSSRDGNLCWQHAVNASNAGTVRADTAGGILVSTRKTQIVKIPTGKLVGNKAPPVKDPKHVQLEALEAKKKNLLWYQERTKDPRAVRERMMQAAKTTQESLPSDTVVVKNGEDDLEIEFEDDPRKTAPAMFERIEIVAALPAPEPQVKEPVEEPPSKKRKTVDENMKLTLPTFSSDSEDETETKAVLSFNERELEEIRAKYR